MNDSFLDIVKVFKADRWDDLFFREAALWRGQSHDLQTQCGCVLVKDKISISTGYNGFIRDIDDSVLPRLRPEKYPFMIHAEANAIYNAVRHGRGVMGSTAYVTGPPCLSCLQMLYQCGIEKIKFTDISNPQITIFSKEYRQVVDLIAGRMSLHYTPKDSLFILETKSQKNSLSRPERPPFGV